MAVLFLLLNYLDVVFLVPVTHYAPWHLPLNGTLGHLSDSLLKSNGVVDAKRTHSLAVLN